MSEPFPFDPPRDPLGRNVETPHPLRLPVLGIATRFESNAARVIEIARDAFGGWRCIEGRTDVMDPHEVVVRVIMEEGDEGGGRTRIRYRMPDGRRVLLTTPGSAGISDPDRREATAFVTAALVADAAHFRYGVIEALTIALLSQLDRQPVHAAALVRSGAALLLAGPSGAGKSTLAYAATRAGCAALAEDVVYVQLRPRLRVWGLAARLHLPEDAGHQFPDLDASRATLLASGKRKIALDLRAAGAMPGLPFVERAGLCLLARAPDGEAPAITRVSADEVMTALGRNIEPGFDVFSDT
ncbi:MAG: hypothetical protein ACRELX_05245, partial [Longimicrobiales bacterium]